MKNIFFIRHTQSEANLKNILASQLNFPLTENGKKHAFEIGSHLKKVESIDRIISSPLIRAHQTACLIANHGQVAFGQNLEKAFELAQEIENICHQYINAIRIGIPKILSNKEMKIVLAKFKNYKKG